MNNAARMTRRSALALALTAAATLAYGATIAEASIVINNPSFEVDSYTAFTPVVSGWTRLPGSNSSFPSGMNNSVYGATPYGQQYVVLGAIEDGGSSALEQAISGFTVGATYQLSFAMASEFVESDRVNVSFVGSSVAPQDFSAPPYPGGGQFWYTWVTQTETFVADATTMTLHLHSYGTNYEPGIDNFQITQLSAVVPEPSTLAIAGLGGLGILGYARRRSRRAA